MKLISEDIKRHYFEDVGGEVVIAIANNPDSPKAHVLETDGAHIIMFNSAKIADEKELEKQVKLILEMISGGKKYTINQHQDIEQAVAFIEPAKKRGRKSKGEPAFIPATFTVGAKLVGEKLTEEDVAFVTNDLVSKPQNKFDVLVTKKRGRPAGSRNKPRKMLKKKKK